MLFLNGEKTPSTLEDIVTALQHTLPNEKIGFQLAGLLTTLKEALLMRNLDAFLDLKSEIDNWIQLAGQICQSLDEQLDLGIENVASTTNEAPTIDLSSFECPLHYVKARNEMRKLSGGDVVTFIFESGEPSHSVTASLKKEGHDILNSDTQNDRTFLTVRKVAE